MRATMRITWLLLSLSFLFHGVCSDDQSQNTTPKDAADVTTAPPDLGGGNQPEVTTSRQNTITGTTGEPPADDGKKNETTQQPTTTPTSIAVNSISSVTVQPVPTKPQVSTVQNNIATPLTSISRGTPTAVYDTTPAAGTSSPVKTTTLVATTDSSSSLVASPSAATAGTSATSLPKTSATEAPVSPPGNATHEGTTKIPKVSTDALTTRQQTITAHTTSTSSTSQEGGKGGSEKIIVTVTSHGQPTSKALWPAGSTGTTSTPSTLTKAGLPPAETISTKAGTTLLQTIPATTTTTTTTTAAVQPKIFLYSLNSRHEKEEEKDLVEVCRRLMVNLQDGNCTLTLRHQNGKIQFDCVEINGKVKTTLATQYYEEITKPTDNKTLIAILASSGALLIMIVILAVCASHHRKPYNENQQHLTEELHTVENGYHDNPTLEVMEVQPEMQEKKMALNGEFNDSWIVPIDNLLKEDIPDEEDTHL
ncbi:podocalyxin isoform X1 [Chaetodon auriga]|uniref:podocalyxin isoform X1 n=1 Tax=Chaetodon auriga TaxID=39042 RepID=UPI004032F596